MRPQSLLLSFATLALVTQFTFAQDAAKTVPAVKIVPAAGVDAPPRAAAVTTLKLGDAAPAFQVDSWVKGDSFTSLEKGNVYVMEFWATWCGPCITAMPHLSALQKQYPDVRFVGVAASVKSQTLRRSLHSLSRRVMAWAIASSSRAIKKR